MTWRSHTYKYKQVEKINFFLIYLFIFFFISNQLEYFEILTWKKMVGKKGAAAHSDDVVMSVNERILRDCHNVYTDPKDGLVNIAKEVGIDDILAPRKKINILLIGNHSAGKSSFVNWYVEETVNDFDVLICDVPNFKIFTIKLSIGATNWSGYWDTGLHAGHQWQKERVTARQCHNTFVSAAEGAHWNPQQSRLRQHGDLHVQAEEFQLDHIHWHARPGGRRHEVSVRCQQCHLVVRRHIRFDICLLWPHRTGALQANAESCREAEWEAWKQDTFLFVQSGRGGQRYWQTSIFTISFVFPNFIFLILFNLLKKVLMQIVQELCKR